ncbi:hypothetical protein O6H91_12G095100 [Diphasiastrum complanatum]|uniref:Uncharacterized protein n=1 Tax=Diphasiastrum complanatum TaxID=34168 RepID=A0ACC2C503_DIPCM|nr:hypothetical protein O6H91_12G095100 [Diphasiastrum complanatum]
MAVEVPKSRKPRMKVMAKRTLTLLSQLRTKHRSRDELPATEGKEGKPDQCSDVSIVVSDSESLSVLSEEDAQRNLAESTLKTKEDVQEVNPSFADEITIAWNELLILLLRNLQL